MGLTLNSGYTIGPGVVLDAGYIPTPPTPSFITTGLRLHLDAGNPVSFTYPSTTWTDLIDGKVFTLFNNPTHYSDYGGYLNFSPGAGQYAEATSLPDSLSHWTVEAWHYYDGTLALDASPCIVTEVYAGNPINFTLGNCTDTSPNLQVGHWDGGSFNATPQGIVRLSNHWYHVVGTYDGTAHKLYINGELAATQATTSTASRGGVGIRLMCRWDVPQFWGGALAVVRIYDNALGDAGVLQNYTAGQTRFGL